MHACRAAASLRAPGATSSFEDLCAGGSDNGSDTSAIGALVKQRCPRVSAVLAGAMRRKSGPSAGPSAAAPSCLGGRLPRGLLPSLLFLIFLLTPTVALTCYDAVYLCLC